MTRCVACTSCCCAARLQTTRGAPYKTPHDARKKLRAELAAQGLDIATTAPKEAR